MDPIISALVYKLVSLAGGIFVCFLGYRLFVLGIFAGGGDMDAQFREGKLVMKKAAPGTFFALFGAAVIGFTVWKGVEFRTEHPISEPNFSLLRFRTAHVVRKPGIESSKP